MQKKKSCEKFKNKLQIKLAKIDKATQPTIATSEKNQQQNQKRSKARGANV